jgi:hypothetical protein
MDTRDFEFCDRIGLTCLQGVGSTYPDSIFPTPASRSPLDVSIIYAWQGSIASALQNSPQRLSSPLCTHYR